MNAQLFINGEFVDASDGKTFDLYSPYSGDLVGKGTSGQNSVAP